jgi:hypothetical protein
MWNSFAMDACRLAPARNPLPMHRAPHRSRKIFKKSSEKMHIPPRQFSGISRLRRNPLKRKASSIVQRIQEIK